MCPQSGHFHSTDFRLVLPTLYPSDGFFNNFAKPGEVVHRSINPILIEAVLPPCLKPAL